MLLIRNISLILLMIFINIHAIADDKKISNEEYYKKFQFVFEKVLNEYVEEPDREKMLEAALSGMLSSLDPHSSYFTKEDFEDLIQSTKGEFGGIGVEILYEMGAIKVISPIDDLPAAKAGIKAGDYIIAVNDETVSNLGFYKAVKSMRGTPGTKVKLSVITEGDAKPRDLELTRDIVKIKAVKSKLDGDIAYIRIVTFNEHTMTELKKAMAEVIGAAKSPIKGIVLDLRNNPGGLLKQANDVSDYFLNSGTIVSTKGRLSSSEIVFSASKFTPKGPKVPIVVLINAGSASASEIVAGALQDHKRAIILGTKSFGKGSVQTLMELDHNTGMKLTTAKYYTPSGTSIQAEGINPDIIVEQAKIEYPQKDENKRFSEASLKNALKNDSAKKDEDKEKSASKTHQLSDMYKEDYQYSKAYDLLIGISINNGNK
jgi:carboxyl-terminal processing protease